MNKRLTYIQVVLVIGGLAFSYFQYGSSGMLAACYGGAVALINTIWLSRGVENAGEIAQDNPQLGTYRIFFGAVQRFVFVLVAIGVGLAALSLRAEPLLLTFALAQAAYFIGARTA